MQQSSFPASRSAVTLFLFLFFAVTGAFSQAPGHGNVWYFGAGVGLDFNSGQPVKLTGINVDSYEGCAIYCDADGAVLLYTNGGGIPFNAINGQRDGIIWNRDQQVMFNMGDATGGGYSAAQSAVIVPDITDTNRYYVFTMDHNTTPAPQNRGMSYFLTDMSLNGGLGAVVQAGVPVYKPATEGMAAVKKSDGTPGYWIVATDKNSKDFVLAPLTATGVGTPVVRPRAEDSDVLVIKASPQANSLCVNGEIYDFASATGTLTFREKVTASGYTFSYSPRGRYLYALESDAAGAIVRYDLTAADIAASKETLTFDNETPVAGHMQIGPDGNIYWIEQLSEDFLTIPPTISLSVVRCPDGATPEVERAFMKFDTDFNNAGGFFTSLPNFPDWIFARDKAVVTSVITSCDTSKVTLKPAVPGLRYLWSNGAATPEIEVSVGPGETATYTLRVEEACDFTDYSFQVTNTGNVQATIEAPVVKDTCSALPLTLQVTAAPGSTFQWSDGSTADSLRITDFGAYNVTVTTSCGSTVLSYNLPEPEAGCCFPFTPNAFTPNNDGVNDRFSPVLRGCDVEYLEFNVYSRWGELMYQGFQASDRWDGTTLNGTEAPSDIYVYTARYKLEGDPAENVIQGNIALLR